MFIEIEYDTKLENNVFCSSLNLFWFFCIFVINESTITKYIVSGSCVGERINLPDLLLCNRTVQVSKNSYNYTQIILFWRRIETIAFINDSVYKIGDHQYNSHKLI
jgi:hypothetical protein